MIMKKGVEGRGRLEKEEDDEEEEERGRDMTVHVSEVGGRESEEGRLWVQWWVVFSNFKLR